MGYLPKFKIGNCDCGECAGVGVQGRKVAKDFMCMIKYNKMKTNEQVAKSIKRDDNRRAIINSEPKIRLMADREQTDRYNALDRWFKERRKEMTGKCHHCNGSSCRDNDKYFKFSICHILPKAYFPSVATNEYNWVELCFWKNNCHGNMDNRMLDLIDMNCWDEIVTKFLLIYPHIAENEKRRIPPILIEYLKTEL